MKKLLALCASVIPFGCMFYNAASGCDRQNGQGTEGNRNSIACWRFVHRDGWRTHLRWELQRAEHITNDFYASALF